MKCLALTAGLLSVAVAAPVAAQNRIDGQSADAPELAAYGALPVGVRRIELVNPDQVDVAAFLDTDPRPETLPRHDRPLTVEVWYPAAEGATDETALRSDLRDGETEITLQGRAMRDAAPAEGAGPFPLVLISHGFPGNRFLMAHLAENLASKGYVVASIDHTGSTYRDQGAFASTLVNRPLDQRFVVDAMAGLGADAASGLAGLIDADNTALIGYSMGGYGALITAGAGLTEAAFEYAPPEILGRHRHGSAAHAALPDPRIRTVVAIAPWGMNNAFWDAEGLAGIEIPMLFFAGASDEVSGYEAGVRAIWEGATNGPRAMVTFEAGGHNIVAPIPAPAESFAAEVSGHYTDPVWDTVFMNNVGQHFLTAWLGRALKGDAGMAAYLDPSALGGDGNWPGFAEGTTAGLIFEVLEPAAAP